MDGLFGAFWTPLLAFWKGWIRMDWLPLELIFGPLEHSKKLANKAGEVHRDPLEGLQSFQQSFSVDGPRYSVKAPSEGLERSLSCFKPPAPNMFWK